MPGRVTRADDRKPSRRQFVGTACAMAVLSRGASAHAQPNDVPVTGIGSPSLASFDKLMTSFLAEHKAPGAALAVTNNSRLVYARGFGLADVENKEPVQPSSLFRIASLTKPFTAVAIMQLVERKKLALDDKVLDRMELGARAAKADFDTRWKQITVRHCLQHTAGWDRSITRDPVERPLEIAKALGIEPPVLPMHVVRYMMTQPLDFEPGARHYYSNVGYLVLGRIIEAVAGQTYESYVKADVLRPLGITKMRLGRALAENKLEGEVRYYDTKNRTVPSVYPPVGRRVPGQYGGDNFEAYEAHGGWVGSAVDMVRFVSAFDKPTRCPLLNAASIEQMWGRPPGAAGHETDGKPKASYYACGWHVRSARDGKATIWHGGLLNPGSSTQLMRRSDGVNWAILFNTDRNADGKSTMVGEIEKRLHEAVNQVKSWPNASRFDMFYS